MQNILFMFAYIVAQIGVPPLRSLAVMALLRHLAWEMAGLGRFTVGGKLAAQTRIRRRARYLVGEAWLGWDLGEGKTPTGGRRCPPEARATLQCFVKFDQ